MCNRSNITTSDGECVQTTSYNHIHVTMCWCFLSHRRRHGGWQHIPAWQVTSHHRETSDGTSPCDEWCHITVWRVTAHRRVASDVISPWDEWRYIAVWRVTTHRRVTSDVTSPCDEWFYRLQLYGSRASSEGCTEMGNAPVTLEFENYEVICCSL